MVFTKTANNMSQYILWALSFYPDSFVIRYPKPRLNINRRWFLVTSPNSKLSEPFPDTIGEDLIRSKQIIPELSEEEYQVQLALGSTDYRVYKPVTF